MAINEMVDQSFTCTASQLVPPAGYPLLNQPYPTGFSGNQVCPFTSGSNYIDKDFDLPVCVYKQPPSD